jgi:pimeloyl-ACP methyl ester carboxylesterase
MPQRSTRFSDIELLDEGPASGTPVVLVHGFPDVPATWDAVVAALPAGVRAIRPTLRGVGGSRVTDPRARSGQVAALATDVLDLLDGLDLPQVVLVGHDWGARAAHALAVLAPERVRGLVTMSTAYGPSSLLSGRDALAEARAAWYRYWLCTAVGEAGFRRDPAAFVRWAWEDWSPSYALPAGALDRILAAVDTDGFADHVVHYYRHGAGEAPGADVYAEAQEILDRWPAIGAPATFLIGTADGCETPALARANAHLFPAGRELVELDGVGHFIPREAPQAVVDAIARHL